jgi:hypothetical protein
MSPFLVSLFGRPPLLCPDLMPNWAPRAAAVNDGRKATGTGGAMSLTVASTVPTLGQVGLDCAVRRLGVGHIYPSLLSS